MKQQQRMAIMKGLMKENQIKRKDGRPKSLVGRGVACTGWEDPLQKRCQWLEYMKKKDDDSECRRECWTSPQNHEANDVEKECRF